MSIDEAAAVKAVQDGLDGRNVPIVHEEIRVVLAMALERDALRAQLEAVARERDDARKFERMADKTAIKAKCERDEARADAARLREALEGVRRRIEVMGVGEQSDSVRVHNRLLNQSEDALKVIIDALSSAPSGSPLGSFGTPKMATPAQALDICNQLNDAEPTPRDTLNTPQPPPATDDAGPEVWPALLAVVAMSPELRALCEERDATGRAKYGTALRVNNGREPLVDALQEALDLAVYLQQAWMRSRDARLWWARNSALELAQELLDEVKP